MDFTLVRMVLNEEGIGREKGKDGSYSYMVVSFSTMRSCDNECITSAHKEKYDNGSAPSQSTKVDNLPYFWRSGGASQTIMQLDSAYQQKLL